jgi:hypothetical protein
MRKIIIASILGSVLCLSGCVISVDGEGDHSYKSSWQNQEKSNRQALTKLVPGLSVNDVEQRMGIPDFNELYEKNGDTYQIFFYRTQRREEDGVTTKEECTPLIFKNGALNGWGDTAYTLMKN